MKKIFKILKKMGIVIGGIILLILIIGILFVNLSPEFGGKISKEQKKVYSKSANHKDGKFVNTKTVNMDMSMSDMGKTMVKYFSPPPKTVPKNDIPTLKIDSVDIVNFKDSTRLIWFGHSTFLLQIKNKNILIDPMFGKVPAPNPLLGGNRFSKELPIEIEQLPKIDAVIISHDHYDHLDYGSIKKLKDKVGMFYTPLGVGAHLKAWKIDEKRIVELDWWEEVSFEDLIFRCAPAQHFSGRGVTDRFSTLWCSWIIKSDSENIFFSGDSGYAPHFKEIGEKYGPFDLAMLECGQYNELWADIHMFPEETALAGIDLKAKKIMPIHWGAFKLAMHSWTDPIERVSKKANDLDVDLITPQIGEPIFLGDTKMPTKWWQNVEMQ